MKKGDLTMSLKEFQDIEKLKKQIQDKEVKIQKEQADLELLKEKLVKKEHQYMMNLLETNGMNLTDVITMLGGKVDEKN